MEGRPLHQRTRRRRTILTSVEDAARSLTARDAPAHDSPWIITSATVPGAYHLEQDMLGDDAHAWAETDGGGFVFAVADGVGSARLPAIGSQLAVEVALTRLLMSPEFQDARSSSEAIAGFPDVFHQVANDIAAFGASQSGLTPEELATTLCIGIVTPEWTAAAHLGDGAVVVRDAGSGSLRLLLAPQRLEYEGLVYSASIPRNEERLRAILSFGEHGPISALAATTDGLVDLSLNVERTEPHAPFFQPLFATVEARKHRPNLDQSLTAFLQSERVARAARDDLTLLLVTTNPDSRLAPGPDQESM